MNTTRGVCLALWLFVMATLSACSSKSALQLKLEEGDSRYLHMEAKRYMTMSVMGTEMDMGQEETLVYKFEVQNVAPDGESTVKVTYDDISIHMDLPMMERMPAAPSDMFAWLEEVKGKSFTIRLTPLGKVVEIDGADEILDTLAESVQRETAGFPGGGSQMFENIFSDEAIREAIEGVLNIYRLHPVGVGDAWTVVTTRSVGMPLTSETTYTVAERKAGSLTLNMSVVIKPNEGATAAFGPMEMEYAISGTGTGTLEVDEATGWIRSGEYTLDIDGEVSILGMPVAGGPMTISVKERSTISSFPA